MKGRLKSIGLVLALLATFFPLVAFAAVGTTLNNAQNSNTRRMFTPVALMSSYLVLNTDVATADNSGSVIVNPGAISRAAVIPLSVQGGTASQFLFRGRYLTGGTSTIEPVVEVFGQDAKGAWQVLYAGLGSVTLVNGAWTLISTGPRDFTLTVDTTNDVQDGVYSYTQTQCLDVTGLATVLVGVKTAGTGNAWTGGSGVVQGRAR